MDDIRWDQRFSNFNKALKKLFEAVSFISNASLKKSGKSEDVLTEIIKEGLIQRFEYTYEMAWNVMKDYAAYQGNTEITGFRDAIRYAFSVNLIEKGEMWMDMIKSRIKTTHTYSEQTAQEIYDRILIDYYPAFIDFQQVMFKKQYFMVPERKVILNRVRILIWLLMVK